MAKRNNKITLVEIETNIRLVREFMVRLDPAAFERNTQALYAVVRALEIISEAARRLSVPLKARHPDIPRRQVVDAGNAYRHVYHQLQASVIWNTTHEPLDDLLAVVEKELKRR